MPQIPVTAEEIHSTPLSIAVHFGIERELYIFTRCVSEYGEEYWRVIKEDNTTYECTLHHCSCPGSKYHKIKCKHMRMLEFVLS